MAKSRAMAKSLRSWLKTLGDRGLLVTIRDEVDLRYVPLILDQNSGKPVLFERVSGYEQRLTGGIMSSRELVALSLDAELECIREEYVRRVSNPIEPKLVSSAPHKARKQVGEEVNLASLPIPLQHSEDGGPYISAGLLISKDPDKDVYNIGAYRLMYRTRRVVSIDMRTPSRTKRFYEKALAKGEPLPIAIAIGTHPVDIFASQVKPGPDVDELAVLGGLRGEPVELVRCETLDLLVPADAEIVLEGEILPIGWCEDEGPYGEWMGYVSGVTKNPIVLIKAITQRDGAIFQTITQGGKNFMRSDSMWALLPGQLDWAYNVLKRNGFDVKQVNVTPGGCNYWHVVFSMRVWSQGEARNALLTILSNTHYKYAIAVDEDIDVFDHDQVEWAIATRVQPARDIILLTGLPTKPLDPSLESHEQPVTTSKVGIDATKDLRLPARLYQVSRIPFDEEESVVKATSSSLPKHKGLGGDELIEAIKNALKASPMSFYELLKMAQGESYRAFLEAWSRLREEASLYQDEEGRYSLSPREAKKRAPSYGGMGIS